MANILSKVSLPTATKETNRFNLSCRNTTTMDFFKIKPVYTRELMPNSNMHMKLGLFSRLAPMVKPAYVDVNFVSRAFFVPFRTVMEGWNEFITDTQYKQQIPRVPKIFAFDILSAFCQNGFEANADFDSETAFTYPGTATSYDLVISDSAESSFPSQYYKFTRLGRHIYDVLVNLGYGFRTGAVAAGHDDQQMSLLPLLCYYKLFQDWYRNPAYNYAWKVTFPVAYNFQLGLFGGPTLYDLLYDFRYGFYERNYFTAAWDNPVAPNSFVSADSITISDETLHDSSNTYKSRVSQSSAIGTPVIQRGDGGSAVPNLTKYILQSLGLLTDYVKRHQLVGTQAMERFLARFGIQLTDAKLSRSVYIDKMVANVRVGDLMNTTSPQDSSAAALGEYAGRGEGSGVGDFNFKTDEFGQFFVVSCCIPQVQYVQGVDRALSHISRLSFFTPEFDSLGMQAIRCDEVVGRDFGSKNDSDIDDWAGDDVFGFTSRYAEYKTAVDRASGDFCFHLDDPTNEMNVYHLARLFNPFEKPEHSLSFTRAEPSQFNRIFADMTTERDHFINIFYFDVKLTQPCSRLFDDYEFEDEDSGRRISLPLNGVQKD